MSFQPSRFSYQQGISGTSADQWMRSVYRRPDSSPGEAPSDTPDALKPLEGPSPWTTVGLAATKQGVDHLGLMETATTERPQVIEWVLVVGHIGLGVAIFQIVLWSLATLGTGIEQSVKSSRGHSPQGEQNVSASS